MEQIMRTPYVAFVLLGASAAYADDSVIEVPFAPPTSIFLDIHETRTRTSTDERRPNGVGQVSATLEINGGDPPYGAIWTTTRVEVGGQVIVPGSPGAAQLLVGMPVGLELGEDGSPIAVRDWTEFRERVVRAVSELTPPPERTEQWRRAIEATEWLFASMNESNAARLLVQDVGMMALCQHTGLAIGEPLRSESTTPNPLGGSPIRTLVSYELVQVDQSARVARLIFNSAYDPESVTDEHS
jgi:hypothetical protein